MEKSQIVINPASFINNIKNNCNRYIANSVYNNKIKSIDAAKQLVLELLDICELYVNTEGIKYNSKERIAFYLDKINAEINNDENLKNNQEIQNYIQNLEKIFDK